MTLTLDDAIAELRQSPRFLGWNQPKPLSIDDIETSNIMKDRHFEPAELGELWGVSAETIRSIFRNEPGVLKIGKTGGKYKRGYVTLRIPESVAEKVHSRLSS
jgi:hypothetical protein